MSCMWQEHTTRSPNQGLWIEGYGLSPWMATESRYMTSEVKEVMLQCHHRLKVYSCLIWMLQQRVVSGVMYPGTSYTQHQMQFWMSTPICASWSRRSWRHRKYWYQSHRLPWSTDHWQWQTIVPRVMIPVVIPMVAIRVVFLEVKWRITWVVAMKMIQVRVAMRMRTIHH